MHWEKSPPGGQPGARPYQGVRVRDPVKELLRKKRGLDLHSTKTAPPAAIGDIEYVACHSMTPGLLSPDSVSNQGPVPINNLPSYADMGQDGFEAAGSPSAPPGGSDGADQYASWTSLSTASQAPNGWPCHDYPQQPDPASLAPATFTTTAFAPPTLSYPAGPALAGDVYMQHVCPSYTVVGPPSVLTYTHTPLFTNFGTLPALPGTPGNPSLPQMDLQDTGFTYIPWAQPFTTLSSLPTLSSIPSMSSIPTLSNLQSSGLQFSPCPASLPGSPLLPVPLPLSTMPQTQTQTQTLEEALEVDQDPDQEQEPINPLEKLLEDQGEAGEKEEEEEGKGAYSTSLFSSDV